MERSGSLWRLPRPSLGCLSKPPSALPSLLRLGKPRRRSAADTVRWSERGSSSHGGGGMGSDLVRWRGGGLQPCRPRIGQVTCRTIEGWSDMVPPLESEVSRTIINLTLRYADNESLAAYIRGSKR
eukprot:6180437-Pleurochrysis_carterae.AAC.5